MNTNAEFGSASPMELDDAQGIPLCMGCHERSSLCIVVAELLYKNQALRFKLSQSRALIGQLMLAFDEMQAHRSSSTEIKSMLIVLKAVLKPGFEC